MDNGDCYISMLPSLSALKVSLRHFDGKRRLLRKNKQHSMLHELMNEPFLVVRCKQRATPRLDPAEVEVLAQVNQTLTTELSGAQKLISL